MKQLVVLAAVLVGFIWGSAFAQTYKVDAAKSALAWTGEKITGKHHGTIAIKDGELVQDGAKFSGVFNIDMNSIVNEDLEGEWNGKLVGHLKSDDFFSVADHPVATLKVNKVAPYNPKEGETTTHVVTGDLTIKGITHEISFPATISFTEEAMTANAAFSIDRTKWNVRFRSGSFFENLGDKMIYDDIKFDLTLVADKLAEMSMNK